MVSADTQSAYDYGILVSLVINVVLAIIFVLLFEWWRRKFPEVYESRLSQESKSMLFTDSNQSIQPPSKKFFGWIRSALSYSDETLFNEIGLDALMYLRFIKMLFLFVALQSIFGLVILFPVNATGPNKDLDSSDEHYASGSAIVSMANIDHGSNRLIAHMFSVLFNSAIIYVFLFREYKQYVHWRYRYMSRPSIDCYTVMATDVPPAISDEQILNRLQPIYGNLVTSVTRVQDVKKLWDKLNDRAKLLDKLEHAEFELRDTSERPMARILPKVWKKVDAIEHFTSEIEKQDAKIEEYKSKIVPSDVVLISFSIMAAASQFSQSVMSGNPWEWFNSMAPDSDNLVWQNIGKKQKILRKLISTILITLLVFFWVVPVGFVSSLSNLSTLSSVPGLGFLVSVFDLNDTVKGFVQGFLPSLALIIFMILLVPIISGIVWIEGNLRHSEIARSIMSKYFYFQVVNVFLAITILGSAFGIVDQAEEVINEPVSLITLFANAVPQQSNFFINYVLINSFISFTLLLWRPAAVIIRLLMLKFFVKTKRDFIKINEPPPYLISIFYAQNLLFYLLILVYSTLAPLIVPFGVVYFLMANVAMRYHLIFVVKNKFEGGGNLWEAAVQRVCAALLVYQFVVGAVLLGYEFVPGAVIVFVSCIVTLVYWIEMRRRFLRCTRACPLEECKEHNEKIMGEYNNPALEPLETSKEKESASSV